MKKNYLGDLAALIIWLLPLIYFMNIYSSLPLSVPTHFGIDGKPDRYSSKQEMIWIVLFLSVITLAVYFLIKYLPKIDPKKTAGYSTDIFKKISFVCWPGHNDTYISLHFTLWIIHCRYLVKKLCK